LTVLGATGHQDLPVEAREYLVREVDQVVANLPLPLRVVSALAAGADQLVADAVLGRGGSLEVVVPASDYETTLSGPDLDHYQELLESAAEIVRLAFAESSEAAYWAAGQEIVGRCDVLIAVWDGRPARGLGGTGDVVEYARAAGKPVHVVWPDDLERA
jgi:hypothetical protein